MGDIEVVNGATVIWKTAKLTTDNLAYREFFPFIAKWFEQYYGAHATPVQMRGCRSVVRMVAALYPQIVENLDKARKDPECAYLFSDVEWWRFLNAWLTMENTEYINQVGCDCGKRVDLLSDRIAETIAHIEHKVYREWAWRHLLPEERERMMLL